MRQPPRTMDDEPLQDGCEGGWAEEAMTGFSSSGTTIAPDLDDVRKEEEEEEEATALPLLIVRSRWMMMILGWERARGRMTCRIHTNSSSPLYYNDNITIAGSTAVEQQH